MLRWLRQRPWLALVAGAIVMLALPAQGSISAQQQITVVELPPEVERELQPALGDPIRVIITLPGNVVADLPPPAADAAKAAIAAGQDALVASYGQGLTIHRRYQTVPALAATVSQAVLDALRLDPNVVAVDPDRLEALQLVEGRALMRVDDVHIAGVTGLGVTVAVIDTGVDTDHPDIADDLVGEACFVIGIPNGPNKRDPGCPNGTETQFGTGAAEDQAGHGTSTSGIITSGGLVAPLGVAPDASIYAYNVFGPHAGAFDSDILAALDHVNAQNISVPGSIQFVNMSLGGGAFSSDCSAENASIAATISTLRSTGTGVFVASGNGASSTGISFPSCITPAISVGAVYDANIGGVSFGGSFPFTLCTDASTAVDQIACFSNSTAGLDANTTPEPLLDLLGPSFCAQVPDLAAGQTTNTVPGCFGGTSAATPYAAGVAALLLSNDGTLTVQEIEDALEDYGVPRLDGRNSVTTPRVDALASFAATNTAVAILLQNASVDFGTVDLGGSVQTNLEGLSIDLRNIGSDDVNVVIEYVFAGANCGSGNFDWTAAATGNTGADIFAMQGSLDGGSTFAGIPTGTNVLLPGSPVASPAVLGSLAAPADAVVSLDLVFEMPTGTTHTDPCTVQLLITAATP